MTRDNNAIAPRTESRRRSLLLRCSLSLGGLLAAGGLIIGSMPAGRAAPAAGPRMLSRAEIVSTRDLLRPLPGCALTLIPKVSQASAGRTCLERARGISTASAELGAPSCAFDYYQNGPYGSAAWDEGWAVCSGNAGGNYFVPKQFNDQASSWDSCGTGIFYANQPGTSPSVAFPNASFGNFPDKTVPNDSLSSATITSVCTE